MLKSLHQSAYLTYIELSSLSKDRSLERHGNLLPHTATIIGTLTYSEAVENKIEKQTISTMHSRARYG